VDVMLVRSLRHAFREMKPDIVHTHLLHADLFGIPAAKLTRVPAVITGRHNDNAFRRRAPIRFANNLLWRMVDAGIAASDAVRRFCIEVEGATPRKLHTIHYGLEYRRNDAERREHRAALRAELKADADTVLIGIICRLVEQKGVQYGLEAFAHIASQCANARLVIAGDGALRKTLEAQAAALGIANRVHFLGWRADSMQVLAGLDIFMQPSLWEGFGLVLLEAMASRLPIVATNVSAIPEVVAHGETGLLVPPRDVPALATALHTLVADAPLRQHMGLLGEDRLEEQFTAERMVHETLALYNVLASHRRR
jgi:glycosyltransferase involved in cell wall biosynthesis